MRAAPRGCGISHPESRRMFSVSLSHRHGDVLCDESRIRGKRARFPHAPRERHKSLRRFCAVQVGIGRCGRHKSVLYSVKPRVDQERERKIRIGKRIGRTKLDMLSGALCRRDPHKL